MWKKNVCNTNEEKECVRVFGNVWECVLFPENSRTKCPTVFITMNTYAQYRQSCPNYQAPSRSKNLYQPFFIYNIITLDHLGVPRDTFNRNTGKSIRAVRGS